jgi:hypothetical protein
MGLHPCSTWLWMLIDIAKCVIEWFEALTWFKNKSRLSEEALKD